MFRQLAGLRPGAVEEGAELAPLLDVLMILLGATLTLATIQVYTSVHTTLEEGSGSPVTPAQVNEIVVGFDGAGQLTWNGEPLPDLRHLELRAAQEVSDASTRFLLAGDREVPYGFSLRVKSTLRSAGIPEVRELLVQEQEE